MLTSSIANRIIVSVKQLMEIGVVEEKVVALDSTAVKAYSQRDQKNKSGKSDFEARVGRGRRGFLLGCKVHTVCCASSELPSAFTVAPCNRNGKRFIKPLLQKLKGQGVSFKAVLADAQYDSTKPFISERRFYVDEGIWAMKNYLMASTSDSLMIFHGYRYFFWR